jgi:hypothetical protein
MAEASVKTLKEGRRRAVVQDVSCLKKELEASPFFPIQSYFV